MTRQWFAPCKINFVLSVSAWPHPAALRCSTLHEAWRKMTKKDTAQWKRALVILAGTIWAPWSENEWTRCQLQRQIELRFCIVDSHIQESPHTLHTPKSWITRLEPSCQSIIYFWQAIYPGNLYFYLAKQPEGKEWHSEENFTNIYTSCLDDMSMSTSDLWG